MEAGNTLIQGLSGALFVGLSGFLYLHGSYYQRFQHASATQQVRTSLSFAYGALFLILSSILFPELKGRLEILHKYFRDEWSVVSSVLKLHPVFFVAPILALIFAIIGNLYRLVRHSDEKYMKDRSHSVYSENLRMRMKLAAMADYAKITDDRMLATLWRAVISTKLIQITLKNRKIYIGLPLASADPSLMVGGWFKIIPLVSGFRDKDTLSFIETTNYVALFETMANGNEASSGELQRVPTSFDRNDLGILVPWGEITSLTIHDPALDEFFSAQVMDVDDGEDVQGDEAENEISGLIGNVAVTVTVRKE